MKRWLFWTIPIFLFIAQLLYILNSQTQIRYEELAEGVRNPFWLEQRLIYDGTSSNVGWYGSLLIVYKLFGFSLFTAKYFRLFLYLAAVFCLAFTLKEHLGEKKASLPLLVIGLSPSWLFLNTLQTSYGTDLLYFPIALFLITSSISWVRPLGWLLAMIAWMSYPTFILYLPVLLLLYLRGSRRIRKIREIIISLSCFFDPLLIGFLYLKNRDILFLDPKTGSGLFRGAGTLSFDGIAANLAGLFKDLFVGGQSYHFELNQVEFSLVFPIISLILVLGFSLRSLRPASWRSGNLILAWVMLLLSIIIPSFTLDPSGAPGMRRYTPVLAAFYALFIYVWNYLMDPRFRGDDSGSRDDKWRKVAAVILSLLAIHHLSVYPINLIHLKDPSLSKEPIFFNDSPSKSLDNLVNIVRQQDLKLDCGGCRVSEVYAAVKGSCLWNHLNCKNILVLDPNTKQLIPLTTKLWDDYYFEH